MADCREYDSGFWGSIKSDNKIIIIFSPNAVTIRDLQVFLVRQMCVTTVSPTGKGLERSSQQPGKICTSKTKLQS